MKIQQIVILCFISFLSILKTQSQSASIFGVITDKNEAIPYATIVLKENNNVVKGTITDDKGKFKLSKIQLGNYILEVQFIGYNIISKNVNIQKSSEKVNMNTIILEEDTVHLNEVEITTERSTITQKVDRKVITIGKDLSTVGASASDIMTNIPSVSVNQDGEISLRGNENVRILIDGRITNISSTDLLQQIPSNTIKSIELITNPSAKYNPEGMSGIINIILKKNTNLGFNGTLSTGITFGKKTRFNNALNFNYKKGKSNFFGSYGNRLGTQVSEGSITRTIENTNQYTKNLNDRASHLVKLGYDYHINDKSAVSFYTNQNKFEFLSNGTKTLTFFDDESLNFIQTDILNRTNYNASYNVDYKLDFKKTGHNIEFEIDYNLSNTTSYNNYNFTENIEIEDYNEAIYDERDNLTINLDYANPMNDKTTLEFGVETIIRSTNNSYDTNREEFVNSVFEYTRNIYSFYANLSKKLVKWNYNFGIRLEDYNVNSEFLENESSTLNFNQKLFNVYPSGAVSFSPNKKNTYQLSFSRRIDRPSLNQTNPTRQISTPQLIIVGNPRLRPQFTNSVELSYNKKIKKGTINFGGFYRKTFDEINRIGYFDTVNPNIIILNYKNFDTNNIYGLEFSSNYRFNNWWSFNTNLDFYTRNLTGFIEDEKVAVSNTLFNVKLNNSFKATKNLTFQLFTLYKGPQKVLQYELKNNFYINTGARYNFDKGKGTISINFNDILSTRRFAFEAFRTIIQEGEFTRDTHNLYIGFSYRFGGNKNKSSKRKKRDKNVKADKFL